MDYYNIYIKTQSSTKNILGIDSNDLKIVIKAYEEGKEDFFINGTRYWLANLFEIRIFEFKPIEKLDDFVGLAKRQGLIAKRMFDEYLPVEVLKEGGKEVTKDFIKGGYGEKITNGNQTEKGQHLMDIFISHSSQDADIAEALINLIRKAYNLSAERIRCTSVEGYKLPIGITTDEHLKKEIFSSKVFIGIITSHSVTSTYVLFELGARWGTTYPLLPLICDPIGTSLLDGPLKNINALKTTDPSDIHQFIYDLGTHLDSKPESTNSYLKEIQHLKEVSSNRDKTENPPPKTQATKTDTEDYETIIKEQSLIEWPDNYEMQVDHIQRQREAIQKLKKAKPNDLTDEEFQRIRLRAKKEWPLNYEMRVDEEERQIESLRKLKSM